MKRPFLTHILVLAAGLSLCGCAEQLQALNAAIAGTNTSLGSGSPTSSSTPAGAVSSATASLSPSQKVAIQNHLSIKTSDIAITQAREDAKANIEKVLAVSACYPNHDIGRYLAAYAVAGTGYYDFPAPMAYMSYHPKSQCLTVTRVDTWKMVAKNVFSFRAVYVSDASAESQSINYKMIKDPDGTWLLLRP